MPTTFTILRQFEEQRPSAAGRFVNMHITKFMVGDDGPFEVVAPVDGFDPEANLQNVDARARQVIAGRAAANG